MHIEKGRKTKFKCKLVIFDNNLKNKKIQCSFLNYRRDICICEKPRESIKFTPFYFLFGTLFCLKIVKRKFNFVKLSPEPNALP